MTTILSWFYFIPIIFSAINKDNEQSGNTLRSIEYNLSAPDKVYTLSASLREISGITELDQSTIACVQDEHGTIYIHDINTNQINQEN